jgi:hypothetical protein
MLLVPIRSGCNCCEDADFVAVPNPITNAMPVLGKKYKLLLFYIVVIFFKGYVGFI